MARKDWGELLQRFLSDHAATGISPRDWCKTQGLNYNTAKEYIKIKGANSGKKSPNRTPNSGKAKAAKGRIKASEHADPESSKAEYSADTKRNGRSGNPNPANQFTAHNTAALKHGGYARRLLLSDEVSEDARELALDDELFRLRAANLMAAENIGRLITRIDDATDEQKKAIRDEINFADKAMMRNTVRIESLEYTKASIRKLKADTDYRIVVTEKGRIEVKRMDPPEDGSKGGGPQIIINLVNSPDGD